MSITKAPGFDTLALTAQIEDALEELKPTLPAGRRDRRCCSGRATSSSTPSATSRKPSATARSWSRIVLFLFLLNFRTTFITLMAMPLSFAITLLVFKWFGISVNSMTLGGLAVAIGMVVDDAIVDVENVFRRLRENAALPQAAPAPRTSSRAPPARCGTPSSTRRSSSSSSSCRCSA